MTNPTIPKILHQIWIGPKPCPTNLLRTWKEKHPDFEYIFWTEEELMKRNIQLQCTEKIDLISEINGKADIIRWELLYLYGGYFVDADSICIEPFDDFFEGKTGFASYENENNRKGLIATGTMGFIPNHPLCRDIIEWIKSEDSNELIQNTRAWYSVGPALLTKFLDTGNYPDFTIYPSYYFLPIHFTGLSYIGHKKVYAYQEWGTAKHSYDTMNSIVLPRCFNEPSEWVSVLITNYNTNPIFVKECLDSIRNQEGDFGMELIWVDDGSDTENKAQVEELLNGFVKGSRFIKLKYIPRKKNNGHSRALNLGLIYCSYPLIFKMDADDIMLPTRISKQIAFMNKNKNAMICGTNMTLFKADDCSRQKKCVRNTNHPLVLSNETFNKELPNWFMNHPTLCYRKEAIEHINGYTKDKYVLDNIHEDYDLEVRMLRTYGYIYNLEESLLLYRVHNAQITSKRVLTLDELIEIKAYICKDKTYNK